MSGYGVIVGTTRPRAATYRIDGAAVSAHPTGGLAIRIIAIRAPQTGIEDHGRMEIPGIAIMAIDQKRPFVIVIVTTEHKIDSVFLQNGHGVLPHLNRVSLGIG